MRYLVAALHPLLLVVANLGVGSVLYRFVSEPLGLAMAAIGVFLLCAITVQLLGRTRSLVRRDGQHT